MTSFQTYNQLRANASLKSVTEAAALDSRRRWIAYTKHLDAIDDARKRGDYIRPEVLQHRSVLYDLFADAQKLAKHLNRLAGTSYPTRTVRKEHTDAR